MQNASHAEHFTASSESDRSDASSAIAVQVNGEATSCPSGLHLPQFLEQLEMNPRLVAVEYNGEILHRQFWADTEIQEGDRMEIVTIVGGG